MLHRMSIHRRIASGCGNTLCVCAHKTGRDNSGRAKESQEDLRLLLRCTGHLFSVAALRGLPSFPQPGPHRPTATEEPLTLAKHSFDLREKQLALKAESAHE